MSIAKLRREVEELREEVAQLRLLLLTKIAEDEDEELNAQLEELERAIATRQRR
jgi:hypothetical protein